MAKKPPRLVYGVGINDSIYPMSVKTDGMHKIYTTWISMLRRVYGNREKEPSYKGCSVCDEWLSLSKFSAWMQAQDWEGKNLDKDVLVPGNKVYSPDTCYFVNNQINALLTFNQSKKTEYPVGVTRDKPSHLYQVNVRINGRPKYLGVFRDIESAGNAYITAKAEEIRRHGRMQTDPRIMIGLFRHAHALEQKLS